MCGEALENNIVWRRFLTLSLLREAQLGASDLQEPPTGVSALVLAYKDDLRGTEDRAAGGGVAAAPLELTRDTPRQPPSAPPCLPAPRSSAAAGLQYFSDDDSSAENYLRQRSEA